MVNIKLRDATLFVRYDKNLEAALRNVLGSAIINLKFDDYPSIVGTPRISVSIDGVPSYDWQIAKVILGKNGPEEVLIVRELVNDAGAEYILVELADHIRFGGSVLPKIARVTRPWDDPSEDSDSPTPAWEFEWDEVLERLREEAILQGMIN